MISQEFSEDTVIIQTDEPLEYIALIKKGSIKASLPNGELLLKMGDVIGITDICFQKHSASYTTLEPTTLIMYPCKNPSDLSDIIYDNRDISLLFASSVIRQICDIIDSYVMSTFFSDKLYHYLLSSYEDYKNLCLQYAQPANTLGNLESIKPLSLEENIDEWSTNYYEALKTMDSQTKALLYQNNPAICLGLLCNACKDVHHIYEVSTVVYEYNSNLSSLLLNSQKLDLFALLTDLYVMASKSGADSFSLDATISRLTIQLEGNPAIDALYYKKRVNEYKEIISNARLERQASDVLEEDDPQSVIKSSAISALSGSINMILNYADCPEEIGNSFREKIIAWKQLPDKNADDDDTRKLRLKITKLFYEIYNSVFQQSVKDKNIPKIVKMFLNFGYVDEVLSGIQNATYLYSIVDDYHGDSKHGIYTFYEWLLAIFQGKREPSRNEFDVDYNAYIHEMKVTGQITPDVERRMLHDPAQKAMYELHNMFPTVNKITFGRISTFCPVLCEQNILKSLEGTMITPAKIKENFEAIRAIDFSAYYHESIYSNESCRITKEFLHTEILPTVILMPNTGIRAVMWQEIEGRNRKTPARMMLSAFCMADLDSLFIRLTGEFRWEMCKRVQGSRWNDVSDPSLTSYYCDYLQFYRKNNDLSSQAKEQLKLTLQKSKNNYREVFIRDYITWILHEGNGSPRLNKVCRGVLFQFCPFSKDIRQKLSTNPLYTDLISRHDIKRSQHTTHLSNVTKKLIANGYQIPTELELEQAYIDK